MQPIDHHDLLLVIVRLGALLFAARTLGELSQRLNQPSVLGELLAGVILGPSVLGAVSPLFHEWFVASNDSQRHLLEMVSLLGAMLLLLITGLETDMPLIRLHARTAAGASLMGILIAFVGVLLVAFALPGELFPTEHRREVCNLMVATSLSIAAVSVVAKVLLDLDLMRRDIGQTLIAAGLSDDTIGWVLLSVVAGLAYSDNIGVGDVAKTVGKVFAFMVFSFTAGRWLVKKALDVVQNHSIGRDPSLSLVMVLVFAWGAITHAMHFEAILGAFVMGMMLSTMRRLPHVVNQQLESLALGIFAPIFFAAAGLRVDLRVLGEPRNILVALVFFAVAVGGKALGCYLGGRWIGRKDHYTSLSFGAGLNARGGTDVIIATLGLSLGLLTPELFSLIVVVAISASLLTPTAMRFCLTRVQPSAEELRRLEQEKLASDSLVAGLHRVLLPVRSQSADLPEAASAQLDQLRSLEARLLDELGSVRALEVTMMSVCQPGERKPTERYLERLAGLFEQVKPQVRVVEGKQAMEVIGAEAKRQYDLMILGASHGPGSSEVVFNPMVDSLMRLAPCATLVVKGHSQRQSWPPRRIMVRATGTGAAKQAADLAFGLAGPAGSEVLLLHVVVPPADPHHLDARGRDLERQLRVGHEIVDSLAELGAARGINVDPEVRLGSAEDTVLLEVANSREVDLIVVGSHLRPSSDKLYLGVRVERILRESPCPVLVINATR